VAETSRLRIAVTRALPDFVLKRLAAHHEVWVNPSDATLTADELQQAAQGRDVLLLTAFDRLDAAAIARLPDTIRIVATYSVGHEHIDQAAAKARGIAVLYTPDVLSDAVAEMAVLLMLGAARRAHEGAQMLYRGQWTGWTPTQLIGRDLTGARVGIYGMGRIGRTIAHKLAGFDTKLHYHNRSRLTPDLEGNATYHATADGLLAVSDFFVIAAPSSPATRGLLNASAIAKLPKGSVVTNISRGDLVDDDALIAALQCGHIAAAGLDVFNGEPNLDGRYTHLPNVFLQPHQGSSTIGARTAMGDILIDSIAAVMAGRSVSNRLA
jgi:glyoxylate reductase